VYDSSNGVTFPLRPSRVSLVLEGDSPERVRLQGQGDCAQNEDDPEEGLPNRCTVQVDQPQFELRNLTVTAPEGIGIIATASAFSLTNAFVANCERDGLVATDNAKVTIMSTTLTQNGAGIYNTISGSIVLKRSLVVSNKGKGIFMSRDCYLESSDSSISNNENSGIDFVHNAGFSSTNDKIEANGGDGISMGTVDSFAVSLSLTQGSVSRNAGSGIVINKAVANAGSARVKIRQTILNANGNFGMDLLDYEAGSFDLGASQTDPGNNEIRGNKNAGICNRRQDDGGLAQGNRWSACPPVMSTACAGGVDVGGETLSVGACLN